MRSPRWSRDGTRGRPRYAHALSHHLPLPMRSLFSLATSLARGAQLAATGLCLAALIAAAQDEVPFVTTPDAVTLAMLELAGVGAGDHVVDLGSGDGRIVITAA